jgi:hypothetical protein
MSWGGQTTQTSRKGEMSLIYPLICRNPSVISDSGPMSSTPARQLDSVHQLRRNLPAHRGTRRGGSPSATAPVRRHGPNATPATSLTVPGPVSFCHQDDSDCPRNDAGCHHNWTRPAHCHVRDAALGDQPKQTHRADVSGSPGASLRRGPLSVARENFPYWYRVVFDLVKDAEELFGENHRARIVNGGCLVAGGEQDRVILARRDGELAVASLRRWPTFCGGTTPRLAAHAASKTLPTTQKLATSVTPAPGLAQNSPGPGGRRFQGP